MTKPLSQPHPFLGWTGKFNPENLNHNDSAKVKGKRPILLFGDSFVFCEDGITCFEDYINGDSTLNKNYWLLNYGARGYGVDQMSVLFDSLIDKFNNPFVVFSIMPDDINRNLLSIRTGQKPFYQLHKDSLILKGIPIDSVPAHFFNHNPPEIKSYLLNRFLYSNLNIWKKNYGLDHRVREKVIRLNSAILHKVTDKIKSKNLDCVFLIYQSLWSGDGNWRTNYLEGFFRDYGLNYFVSSSLIEKDSSIYSGNDDNYYIKGNGHPTAHYNKIVSDEIKKYIHNFSEYSAIVKRKREEENFPFTIRYYENKIHSDNTWLGIVKKKVVERNIPIDSMIRLDAIWTRDNLLFNGD